MKCPKCGLINEEGGAHCDCGYNFATGVRDRAFVRRRRRWRRWSRNQVLLFVSGVVVIEIVALIVVGRALQPGGLLLLIIGGYLMSWEDVR